MRQPKICAYVQDFYAKQTYKNECMDTRVFMGLRVIIDSLENNGYVVEYAGKATVHQYDYVLVSLTSDCDWWTYISEKMTWAKGNYKVIIGGAGVLHITPFLPFADYFVWGRGEDVVVKIIQGGDYGHSACQPNEFNPNFTYYIQQANSFYPNTINFKNGKCYREESIGCNHKCFFCGYTWQRQFLSNNEYYAMSDDLFGGIEDKERAILDMSNNYNEINFSKLRTTAIDGFSERLRMMVNKRISREKLTLFLKALLNATAQSNVKPHQIKLYNICGYPTETQDDMFEFLNTLYDADGDKKIIDKQWSIVLHSTPFRAMPATPMACAPMSYKNYRGDIAKTLSKGQHKGNIFYQGMNFWAVESMGTESLPTVIISAIAHRGEEYDTENIIKMCSTPKFWGASSKLKQITLEKYFNVEKIFGAYTPETLPSRYLRTYLPVEKAWHKKWG